MDVEMTTLTGMRDEQKRDSQNVAKIRSAEPKNQISRYMQIDFKNRFATRPSQSAIFPQTNQNVQDTNSCATSNLRISVIYY